MKMFGSSGSPPDFTYRMIVFALAITFIFPVALSVFTSSDYEADEQQLLEDYYNWTGTQPTEEAVWALTGIYTPYYSGSYGYTADGWLYGDRIGAASPYQPTQYSGQAYGGPVQLDGDVMRYTTATNDGHQAGDIYTQVTMDAGQKSDIFFTEDERAEQGEFFYYEYSGYRYAFQPLANYEGRDSAGNPVPIVATSTSLSVIWYDYFGQSGLSGQLVISGSDSGVAYITAQQIIRAYDSVNSTAKFKMEFNGLDMNVYIRLNPAYLAEGYSIEECYNLGFWSVMVTSLSTNADAYMGADYAFNVNEIWNTMIDLFTFNTADYGLTGWIGTIASLFFVIPLYAALISIGLNNMYVLVLAGILAAIQGIFTIW